MTIQYCAKDSGGKKRGKCISVCTLHIDLTSKHFIH